MPLRDVSVASCRTGSNVPRPSRSTLTRIGSGSVETIAARMPRLPCEVSPYTTSIVSPSRSDPETTFARTTKT